MVSDKKLTAENAEKMIFRAASYLLRQSASAASQPSAILKKFLIS